MIHNSQPIRELNCHYTILSSEIETRNENLKRALGLVIITAIALSILYAGGTHPQELITGAVITGFFLTALNLPKIYACMKEERKTSRKLQSLMENAKLSNSHDIQCLEKIFVKRKDLYVRLHKKAEKLVKRKSLSEEEERTQDVLIHNLAQFPSRFLELKTSHRFNMKFSQVLKRSPAKDTIIKKIEKIRPKEESDPKFYSHCTMMLNYIQYA